MAHVLFDFYTVATNEDRDVTETILYTGIACQFEIARWQIVENGVMQGIEKINMLIPDKLLPLVVEGVKATDSSGVSYAVKFVEDYGTHQEIYIRKL